MMSFRTGSLMASLVQEKECKIAGLPRVTKNTVICSLSPWTHE